MTESTAESTCPRCGGAVDAAVVSGICPTCLLRQAALGSAADSIPATPWTPPAVDEIAGEFDQLEIMELIGHGGMGAVYKARQKSLGRLVALKILAPQHADNPDFADRFSREGKILAEVNHPNIVTVHDFGRAGDFYFLLMEYVDGINLRQGMTAGRLTPQQALAVVPPICEALQFAHDRGIVHRDIKPENLLLDKEGRIRIADFGIARMLRTEPDDRLTPEAAGADVAAGSGGSGKSSEELTRDAVLGTPQYMAPEQRDQPADVDHRADIYSLGVVLYEMLTGELPGAALLPPSRRVEIDVRLDEIVLRALDQNPAKRYLTATEFRNEVETVVRTPMGQSSPPDKSAGRNTPRSSRCHATTPEQLSTFMGQVFLWRKHGRLTLDENRLTITQGPRRYEIPLHSIRDLSFGQYPMLVNPAGLNFIRVTWEANGETRCLIFSPQEGLIGLPQHFNDNVTEWFQILQNATKTATGLVPPSASARELRLKSGAVGAVAFLMMTLVAPLGIMGALVQAGDLKAGIGSAWWPFLAFGVMAIAVTLPLILILLLRSKRTPDESPPGSGGEPPAIPEPSTSDEIVPPDSVPAKVGLQSRWTAWFLAIALPGFVGFLSHRPGFEIAAVMYGFFGFIGVAGFCELWARCRGRRGCRIAVSLAGLLLVAGIGVSIFVELSPVHATVITRSAVVDQEHLTFLHQVDCPAGWNVWLTLECVQLRRSEPGDGEPREAGIVKRYQAKLSGRGRARIPLDYLPTSDENLSMMRASMGPISGTTSFPGPGQGYSLLSYTTESQMRVAATLIMLPDGQSPDSQLDDSRDGTVRFVTIQPPKHPKLAPFAGGYSYGQVEIVALNRQGDDDEPRWKPNGDVSTDNTLPNRNGTSSAAGKVIKEVAVRVHSETGLASRPVVRFPSESSVGAMGGSFHRPDKHRPHAVLIQTIACPPDLLHTSLDVGIADGDWKTSLTFERHPRQHHFSASTSDVQDGSWEGVVRTTKPAGNSIPLAFSYSSRDDHETRLVYEKNDGTIVPLQGNGSDGSGGLTNSLTTLPLEEFETIERFHVQSRRYEWIEFHNVSLQLGHRTNVEVLSVY